MYLMNQNYLFLGMFSSSFIFLRIQSENNLEIMGKVQKFLKRPPVCKNIFKIQHKINKS